MQPVFRKIANCVRIECLMISVHFIIEYPTYMTYYSILFSCAVGVTLLVHFFDRRILYIILPERKGGNRL